MKEKRSMNKEIENMNIEELLNKYFEGETTCEEERDLRKFFTRGIVPEHLEVYRPMFTFLERETHAFKEENLLQQYIMPSALERKVPFRRKLLYSLSGIAAGLLLLLGIAGVSYHFTAEPDSYVIIDGEQYTDARLIREQALSAFEEVSLSEEEVFASLFEE